MWGVYLLPNEAKAYSDDRRAWDICRNVDGLMKSTESTDPNSAAR